MSGSRSDVLRRPSRDIELSYPHWVEVTHPPSQVIERTPREDRMIITSCETFVGGPGYTAGRSFEIDGTGTADREVHWEADAVSRIWVEATRHTEQMQSASALEDRDSVRFFMAALSMC